MVQISRSTPRHTPLDCTSFSDRIDHSIPTAQQCVWPILLLPENRGRENYMPRRTDSAWLRFVWMCFLQPHPARWVPSIEECKGWTTDEHRKPISTDGCLSQGCPG